LPENAYWDVTTIWLENRTKKYVQFFENAIFAYHSISYLFYGTSIGLYFLPYDPFSTPPPSPGMRNWQGCGKSPPIIEPYRGKNLKRKKVPGVAVIREGGGAQGSLPPSLLHPKKLSLFFYFYDHSFLLCINRHLLTNVEEYKK
jgi:hypothetical protein